MGKFSGPIQGVTIFSNTMDAGEPQPYYGMYGGDVLAQGLSTYGNSSKLCLSAEKGKEISGVMWWYDDGQVVGLPGKGGNASGNVGGSGTAAKNGARAVGDGLVEKLVMTCLMGSFVFVVVAQSSVKSL